MEEGTKDWEPGYRVEGGGTAPVSVSPPSVVTLLDERREDG